MTFKDMSAFPNEANLQCTALEVAVLLFQLCQIKDDPKIGYDHPDYDFNDFIKRCNVIYRYHQQDIEALIYYARLCEEHKRFSHPLGLTFSEFLTNIENRNKMRISSKYNITERVKK